MTFLNPAILIGLIAASIPIIIHLLNLRKLKKIEFSTLTFLKELQKNKIRKIKIKQWILLALRVFIILLLVSAFARPAFEGVAIGGTTSAAKTTAVFILDDTFSMSVVDPRGSYFNQAKHSIKELMNELQEGDEAALILVSQENVTDIQPTTNLNAIVNQLELAEISYASGITHNALIKGGRILEASKNFNKEIYLLTDFQQSRFADPNALSDLSNLFGERVKLYTIGFSGKDIFNLGIDHIQSNTQIFEKDKPVNISAVVTNYGNQSTSNSVISLFINNERVAQQSVNLNSGESQEVFFETLLKHIGNIEVYAELEDDDIEYDNRRFLNLFVPDEIRVAIFTDKREDARFIELALSAYDEGETIKYTTRNLNQLASVNLNAYEVVIIIGTEAITGYERIAGYVNNGGSLFIMPGSETTLQKFRELCNALSLPEPSSISGTKGEVTSAVSFGAVEFEHPVFDNIFQQREKKNIDSPEIYYYFNYSTQGRGISVISLIDNSSFLSEFKKENDKILLMNTAPVLTCTNFPLKSIFVPLITKSVFYLASKDKVDESFIAGETLQINISGNTLPQVKIVKPNNSEEYIVIDNPAADRYLFYQNTSLAGNYRIYSGDNLIDIAAVNHHPLESNIKPLASDGFKDYLNEINFKGFHKSINPDDDVALIVQQTRFGSELWKHFLLLAIFLALIEMFIARAAKKDMISITSKNN